MRASLRGLLVVAAASRSAHGDVSGASAWPSDRVTGGTDKKAPPSFRVFGRAGEDRASPPAAEDAAAGEERAYKNLQQENIAGDETFFGTAGIYTSIYSRA